MNTIELLQAIGARLSASPNEGYSCDLDPRDAHLDLSRLLAIVELQQAAILDSIARSDDHGDSWCSRPIRDALIAADKLAGEE